MLRDRRRGSVLRPRRGRGGGTALLAAAWLVALVLAGCATSGPVVAPPASGQVIAPEESAVGPDESLDEGPDSSDEDLGTEPPTLAPVPAGAKAKPACDAAYKAWVDWWQASALAPEPSDPDATPTDYPPGDPYELERVVFEKCSVEDMAIANARHPVAFEEGDQPAPYIDYDVRTWISDTCEIDADVIGDTPLCQGLPGAAP